MAESFYMQNRHKLLLMVKELHKRGYGNMRIIPSLSPSGVYWRCSFLDKATRKQFNTMDWIFDLEEGRNCIEINLTLKTMADMFVRDNGEFVELCKGKDEEYTKWYAEMVARLEEDELPYAFADYFSPSGFWKTSNGKEIETLPGEEEYYLNY